MMQDYKQQYDTLTSTVEGNNHDLESLRSELSGTTNQFFEMRTQQHSLESEVDSLRARHELTIGLNEERRLQQLKIGIQDSERRSHYLEKEVENILERWHGKVALVRRGIEEDLERNRSKVLAELTDKYMQQLFDKNRQTIEIARVKEEIET